MARAEGMGELMAMEPPHAALLREEVTLLGLFLLLWQPPDPNPTRACVHTPPAAPLPGFLLLNCTPFCPSPPPHPKERAWRNSLSFEA